MISSIVTIIFLAVIFMLWVFSILVDSAEFRPFWVLIDVIFPFIGVIRGFLFYVR